MLSLAYYQILHNMKSKNKNNFGEYQNMYIIGTLIFFKAIVQCLLNICKNGAVYERRKKDIKHGTQQRRTPAPCRHINQHIAALPGTYARNSRKEWPGSSCNCCRNDRYKLCSLDTNLTWCSRGLRCVCAAAVVPVHTGGFCPLHKDTIQPPWQAYRRRWRTAMSWYMIHTLFRG